MTRMQDRDIPIGAPIEITVPDKNQGFGYIPLLGHFRGFASRVDHTRQYKSNEKVKLIPVLYYEGRDGEMNLFSKEIDLSEIEQLTLLRS